MRISRVLYARLINTGNYENERFECEVLLNDGEEPDVAMEAAKQFVSTRVMYRLNEPRSPQAICLDDEDIPY